MITVDGSAGGGQLLRTALSLSVITETPFRIEDIRGERPDPGLNPQHHAAVRVAAELCDADVEGAGLGADALEFRPGSVGQTTLRAAPGTAASVTLLFDTVLPVAAVATERLRLTATGGTNVKWAPMVEYHQLVKLPLLAAHGLKAGIDLSRTGFYPVGGGEATLRTAPSSLSPLALDDRGDLRRVEVYSTAAESLAERRVADRQAAHAEETLADAGLPVAIRRVDYVPADSPGSSLLLRGVYDNTVVGADALGERGRTSEAVAEAAVERLAAVRATDAAVDEFAADQFLLFLALVGGRVHVPTVTEHVHTSLDLLAQFGADVGLDRRPDGTAVLESSAHPVAR